MITLINYISSYLRYLPDLSLLAQVSVAKLSLILATQDQHCQVSCTLVFTAHSRAGTMPDTAGTSKYLLTTKAIPVITYILFHSGALMTLVTDEVKHQRTGSRVWRFLLLSNYWTHLLIYQTPHCCHCDHVLPPLVKSFSWFPKAHSLLTLISLCSPAQTCTDHLHSKDHFFYHHHPAQTSLLKLLFF